MSPALVVAITAVAALVVLAGLASTVARRRTGLVHLAGAGLLEALLVLQAVLAFARMGDGTPADIPTFLGYLFGVLLIPVAGVLWAQAERSRWAGTVLAVAAAAVGVMVWRLLQLWEATGA
ncbi:hypothetical protein E9549_10850 [Blastococcus sp. MG754426]|uniref:hypothetical protein n=1 Tax=unclassified Blastococcus TaxID=2619396 RepID=UPI001EF104B8|nr:MULTISPECIES: hypothetical protein [unclassified Blastococcus]MCF6507896.1 hypothetical protein [Blastococcus sp. MG754426]MCF6512436.1 hypothetical protein [Blastococcus sp. MG754427]MCF6737298.1 hypothetical protein [Blastococcus sp. KM273129]